MKQKQINSIYEKLEEEIPPVYRKQVYKDLHRVSTPTLDLLEKKL